MTRRRTRFLSSLVRLSPCLLVLFTTAIFAQAPKEGLDAVGEDVLMNELASRGLDVLLERAFEVNRIPESQRQAQRSLIALSRLSDPNNRFTAAQRQQFLADVVKGIDQTLPTINDPNVLLRQAYVLMTQGVEREVNTLEYWGENPSTQATVRPVMQVVLRIFDKATQRAKALSDEASTKIGQPNSPFVARFEEYEKLRLTAEYNRQMSVYYLALALDPASSERSRIATEAAEYLKQYDIPDNQDRAVVRNRMAKLAMVRSDFDAARQLFRAVIQDTNLPRPTVPQVYEARYFLAVTELLARNLNGAKKGLEDLLAWQQTSLPNDKASRDGAEAAAVMLQYRIAGLEADLTSDPAAKAQVNARAVALLTGLMDKRPDLRAAINAQLLPKIDDQADLTKLQPLALRAIVARGEQEVNRPRTEKADEKLLTRAMEAADEIIRRRDQSGISAQMVDASALLVPLFLDRLGRKAEAAAGFLDYVEHYKQSNPENAGLALKNAQAVIGELRTTPEGRQDSAVTRQYERFLPLAIAAPFSRREFAFEYARRLQLNGDAKKAVEYYRLVPANDNRQLQAAFGELVALKQVIDDEPRDSAARAQMLADIQKLADRVNAAVDRALTQATTDADRANARSMRVRTLLLAADLSRREQKNPGRALELLRNFEASVTGVANPDVLINEAMYIRVQSYMAMEQYTQATDELVKLLSKTEGAHGAQIVYNLLEKLNADFDRAQQGADRDAMRTLARNRAQLSGFLATWAAQNADANIRKFTYRYSVFDAESQRLAAELEENPQSRQQGMKSALDRYIAMESPENVALYKASLGDARATEPGLYDPQVTLAIGLIQYELGDWQSAADRLGKLLQARKLGSPVETVTDSTGEKTVENDQYWEAALKLVRSNQKLNRDIEGAKTFLKMQYVTWGSHVGGKRWKKEFEALRVELIPDFKLEPTTQTQR